MRHPEKVKDQRTLWHDAAAHPLRFRSVQMGLPYKDRRSPVPTVNGMKRHFRGGNSDSKRQTG